MTFTPEQEAKLRTLLRRLRNDLFHGVDRLIDLVLADDRDAQLLAMIQTEQTKLEATRAALPAQRAAQDAQLAKESQVLDSLETTLDVKGSPGVLSR